MTEIQENNYAFIDGQNLNAGIESAGWKLDYKKFREYLKDKWGVKRAYIFLGFMEEHQDLYNALQEAGFILYFKPLIRHEDSTIKGNIDADMVLQVMVDLARYDKAVIITGDGDFAGLIRHLASENKLKQVVIPNREKYSSLFKRVEEYNRYFTYIDNLKSQLSYGRINTRRPGPRKPRPMNQKPVNNSPIAPPSEPSDQS